MENQNQKQNEIENQIEKQNQIGNENQNQNENQIENQKQNQIENEKENQIENQNENEKENENQNQNQNQIKNQIKNENQNQNQIGNEKENQNENQNQNQIGNEKENKNQNQNEEMDSLRKSMIEIRKSDGSIINRKIAIGIFNKMFAKEQQKWVILLYFFSEKFCAPFFRKYFAQNLEKIEQFEKSFILIKKNYLYFLHTRIKRFFAKNWMIFVRDPEIKEIIQESKKIFLDYYQKYSFIFRVLDPYQYTDYCNEEQNFKNAIEIEKEFKAKPIIESNIFGFSSYSNEKFMLLFGNLNPKHQVQKMVQLANFYSDLGKMDLSQILLQNVDKIVSNSVNERDQFDLLLEKSGLLIKQMKFDESLNLSEKLYSQAINLKMEQKITNFLLKNISICYSKKFLFNESMKFLKMMHKDELGFSDFIQFCNKQAINFMNQMKFDKSQKYLEMAQNSIELTQNFPKDYLVDQYNFHDEITNIFGKETAQMVISFIQKKMFQIKKSLLSFQTLENQGILNCLLGNYEKAYDLFSLQHGNYFARTDKFLVAKSLNYLAHTSYLLGNLSQSLSYHQRSLKMYVELKKDYSIMEHCVFSLVIFQKLGLSSSSEFEYNYSKFQELRPKYEKDEKYSSLINIFEVFFCKTPITLSRKLELITETLEKMKKRGLTYIIVSRFHLKLLIKLEISNPESDLDDLLKKVRNSQNNLAPLLQGYCNILFEIAKIYFKKKDYDLAHSIHMNVLHHRKDFRKGLYLLAKSYQKVAEVYQILNKKDEAIFHYKNALNCYENSPQIYHGEKIPISLKKIEKLNEKLNEILNSIKLN
ncbi:hypothetical protein M0811_08373 [Anaeramoeba ignava]|uniref:Tetratricopeptide repeat protein n=1 Tax=Anaeramoeba ignava TaxID=1746090 RepID=A0A9Q0RB68_ANAIG|nr:hypothetical protein M0811_08373 [Anaeramoeba ignava]